MDALCVPLVVFVEVQLYVIVAAFQTLVPSCLHAHREPVARVLVAEARGQGIEGLGGQVATSFSTRADRHY